MIEQNFFDFYKNKNEKKKTTSSILELEIFNNTNNINNGIKNNIKTIEEIPYYSCSMHVDLDNYVEKKLNLLTNDEFKIFKQIVLEVKNLTSKFGETQLPKSSLAAAFYQSRVIKKFFPDYQNIFEVGPGSGYLSLLLSIEKKVVFNTDVTQAYYIYQHELFKHFKVLNELAYVNKKFIYDKGIINHIPWWIYSKLKKNDLKIDLFVFNNGICELNNQSFDYLIYFLGLINNPEVILIGSGQEKFYYSLYEAIKKFEYNGYNLEKNSCNNEDEIYILKYNKKKVVKNFFKSAILQRNYDRIKQMFFFYNKNKLIFKKGDVDLQTVKAFYKEINVDNKDEILSKKLAQVNKI